jgi:hypothetical protein
MILPLLFLFFSRNFTHSACRGKQKMCTRLPQKEHELYSALLCQIEWQNIMSSPQVKKKTVERTSSNFARWWKSEFPLANSSLQSNQSKRKKEENQKMLCIRHKVFLLPQKHRTLPNTIRNKNKNYKVCINTETAKTQSNPHNPRQFRSHTITRAGRENHNDDGSD